MIRVIILFVVFMLNFSIEAQMEGLSKVPNGSFQIETGILIGSSKNNGISERQLLVPSALL